MHEKVEVSDKVTATIIRGEKNWGFIYIALGFAIAIEGTIIQMVTSLLFPYNIVVFIVIVFGTYWLFICNGKFQNWLLRMRRNYENKDR